MLHPLQLNEVSLRYPAEIAEIRDYLVKTGIPVETPGAIGSFAAKLRREPAFRRDLELHIWAASHAKGQPVSYADALRMLAVAAAGPVFAAEAGNGDTRELLRFVMEARSDSEAIFAPIPEAAHAAPILVPAVPVAVQPVLAVRREASSRFEPVVASDEDGVPSFVTEEDDRRHLLLWSGVAACALLVLGFGLWLLHQPAGVNTASVKAPTAAATPEAAQPVIGSATPAPSEPAPREHAASHRARSATKVVTKPDAHIKTTVARAPAPRAVAPENTAPPATIASTAPSAKVPAPARPVTNAPAPSNLAKADVRPDSKQPSVAKLSRNGVPVYRGSDNPLVVLHTPVVRPTTLGNMASHLTYGPAPQYPSAAVDQNVQGQVRLEAEVDRSGNVISTRVVSGPSLLQEAAVNAVQNWQYRPYLYDGKPIAVNATVVMDFQLQ
jgi:TonB family protein